MSDNLDAFRTGGCRTGTENRYHQSVTSQLSRRYEKDCPKCKYGTLVKDEKKDTWKCIDCGYDC